MKTTALVIAVLLFSASFSGATQVERGTTTLGYMTETAAAVLVIDVASPGEGRRLSEAGVTEVVRGDFEVGATMKLHLPRSIPLGRYLLFLDATGSRPLPRGIVRLAEAVDHAALTLVRKIAGTLDEKGEVHDADAYRALLVQAIAGEDPGLVWHAAIDLARLGVLHSELSDAQAEQIHAAFRSHKGQVQIALAGVVATTARPVARSLLTEALRGEKTKAFRGPIGDALVLHAELAIENTLAAAIEDATPVARASLIQVLGRIDDGTHAKVARKLLADPELTVRLEAAHALGTMARNAREKDPTARIEGRAPLYLMLLGAKTDDERRAPLWAMAQLDDPEAFEQLAELAEHSKDPAVRRYAKRYYERPRQSLILRGE